VRRPVFRKSIVLALALGAVLFVTADVPSPTDRLVVGGRAPDASQACVTCHRDRQPGIIAQHETSAHARRGVGCVACHGTDHAEIFRRKGQVPDGRCAKCHEKETAEFRASRHSSALRDALGSARLMAQIPAMARRGCVACHDQGAPGGAVASDAAAAPTGADEGGRCNSCHGGHRFSAADARAPEACGACHRGPDHPHIEAYEASLHGVTWRATHDERQAPTCATCHMPKGTHLVSGGITIGSAGSGSVLEGETPPIPMKTITADEAKSRRASMLSICYRCHTPEAAWKALADADAIKREADRLVLEAAELVKALHADRLLDPMPEDRAAHPTAGHALVLGGGMLYENQSDAERIFFDLAKFAHAIMFKGAYHQSPDHTHWLGVARLKADLEALKAEDRRLRAQAAVESAPEPPAKR
jgi:hypothetical protein